MQQRTAWLSAVAGVLVVTATASASAAAAKPRIVERSWREEGKVAGVVARLSYVEHVEPSQAFTGQRLVVSRAGKPALDVRLRPARSRWPSRPGHALELRNLDGGEWEVLVNVFTGGANCCYGLYVFRYDGGRYRGSYFDSGRGGLRSADLDGDGTLELVSADSRFDYLFSSGAESFLPIRIFRFRNGRLVAVTRDFPGRIRASEREAWAVGNRIVRAGGNPQTAFAAWAADKYLLGEGEEVWPRLQGLIAGRKLKPTLDVGNGTYLSALRRTLGRFGYLVLPSSS